MAFYKGRSFEREIETGLALAAKTQPMYHFRIPDTRAWDIEKMFVRCPSCNHAWKVKTDFIAPKVPGDEFVVTERASYLLECKSSSAAAFPIPNIKPHQIEESCKIGELSPHADGLFAISRRGTKGHMNVEAWVLSGFQIRSLVDDARKAHKQSIPWETIATYGAKLTRGKDISGNPYWKIEEVL